MLESVTPLKCYKVWVRHIAVPLHLAAMRFAVRFDTPCPLLSLFPMTPPSVVVVVEENDTSNGTGGGSRWTMAVIRVAEG